MSADETAAQAGEASGMSERAARLVLVGVGLLAMWGIVATLPETAYVVVGVLGTHAWQRVRSWLARRRSQDQTEGPEAAEEPRESLPATLHRLARPHVFLAELAAEAGISTEAARAVLESHGIRVRRAVRNGEETGVGVHRDDIPPLPRSSSDGHVEGVDQEQPTNQHRVRVRRTDGGVVLYDLSETTRHHRVRAPGHRT